jgi:hypothetical protein
MRSSFWTIRGCDAVLSGCPSVENSSTPTSRAREAQRHLLSSSVDRLYFPANPSDECKGAMKRRKQRREKKSSSCFATQAIMQSNGSQVRLESFQNSSQQQVVKVRRSSCETFGDGD